jgi:hypothetical protein
MASLITETAISSRGARLQEVRDEHTRDCHGSCGGFKKPVMLYPIGKGSSVLLQVAEKAFHPAFQSTSAPAINATLAYRHLFRAFAPLREPHSRSSAILGNKLDAGLFERLGNGGNSFSGHLDWPPSFRAL